MGQSSSMQSSAASSPTSSTPAINHWHKSVDDLDLHPSSKLFEKRFAGLIPNTHKEFIDPDYNIHTVSQPGKTHLSSQTFREHPETYAIIKDLYDKKIAYVKKDDQYSNTVDLDTILNGSVCYCMPPQYTELEDIFAKEFEEIQAERKKTIEEIQAERKKIIEEEELKKSEENKKILEKNAQILIDLVTRRELDSKTDHKIDGQTEELSFVAVGTVPIDPVNPAAKHSLIPLDIDSVVNNINSVLRRRH
jgi:hypothetical protein